MDATESLHRLETVLRAVGAPVVEYLAPGLTAATIQADLAEVGMVPSADILALYGWHDGIDVDRARGKPNVVAEVAPAIFLQSLAEAMSDRARAIEMADDLARQVDTDAEAFWRRDWLPILKAHHSELFALSASTNEVWSTEWVDGPRLLYPNLTVLVERLIARWESGIYGVLSGDGLSEDSDLQARLEGPPKSTI